MDDSILSSIKKLLGIAEDQDCFDADIIMHINSVFMTLFQLGVGPDTPFHIYDKSATWSDFSDEEWVDQVPTYVYFKVRMAFDPPAGSLYEAMKNIADEHEWRLLNGKDIYANIIGATD